MNIRRYVQLLFLGASVYVGTALAMFLHKLGLHNLNGLRTEGVQAFLPISAFVAFKRLILTGQYDWVHPAGLSLFIIFIIISILYKRSFCGYVCPVGFVSELVSKYGLKKRINRFVKYFFWVLKFLIFGFFFYTIVFYMPIPAMEQFLYSPYNIIADAKMLEFFTHPGMITVIFLIAMVGLSLVFSGFWCRFLCPYGVLHTLVGYLSPFPVKRNVETCTNCMACTKACPMDIDVHNKKTVQDIDCIGCHDCVRARSNDECLKIGRNFDMKKTAMIILGIVVVLIIAAMVFKLWNSRITTEEYYKWYSLINQISH